MIFISLILTLFLSSLCLAFISPTLVLKKEAMFVDAISHSVLPGIVLSFIITRTLDSVLFDIFAVLFSFLTALLLKRIFNSLKISKESIIGLFYTFLFSIGVIMVVFFANDVHLDADAVLFGQVEYTVFDTLNFHFLPFLNFTHLKLLICLTMLFLWFKFFSKKLYYESFDFNFANFNFKNLKYLNYLFYLFLSFVLIMSFKILGVVLVLSLAIAPALNAKLFAKNFNQMYLYSCLYAVLSSLVATFIAFSFDVSIAGTIAFFNMLFLILVNFLNTNFMHKNQR